MADQDLTDSKPAQQEEKATNSKKHNIGRLINRMLSHQIKITALQLINLFHRHAKM